MAVPVLIPTVTCETILLRPDIIDWAIATDNGYETAYREGVKEIVMSRPTRVDCSEYRHLSSLSYTSDWRLGGHIIEKYGISICPLFNEKGEGCWRAILREPYPYSTVTTECVEKTPLLAAMKAVVISRHGDSIEVPEFMLKLI